MLALHRACARSESIYLLLCTSCSLWKSEPLAAMRSGGLGQTFPCLLSSWLCFHIHYKVTECLLTIVARAQSLNLYNFQQRISWLSHRWRTQRNAISNVNCRIQWIIESLNAPCALWYSEGHACLSVIKFSTLLAFTGLSEAWTWGLCWLP